MYPTLYHAIKDILGLEIDLFKFVNSFGMFVVLGFFFAAFTLGLELKRKTEEGVFPAVMTDIVKGKGLNIISLLFNGILGFALGYKFVYVILGKADLSDPPAFLTSTEGSLIGGLVTSLVFMALVYRQFLNEKKRYPERSTVKHQVTASEHAGALAFKAAIWGFAGAKLFHLLEDPSDLIDFFVNFNVAKVMSGLTIYGGLICGGLAVAYYFKKRKMSILSGADAAAPGVMLAYGVGRLGCHFSGDGDWGVVNTATKPSFLPDWLWSYSYPNNVNGVFGPNEKGGYTAKRLTEDMGHEIFEGYGTYLDPGVWPTAVYEFFMALTLFFILWKLRKRISIPGILFGIYLVFVGVERMFIEKYRVNDDHEFMGITATQAEFISVGIILFGLLLLTSLYLNSRNQINSNDAG
jgi:prolipoprotein diacylglyceryltransferase